MAKFQITIEDSTDGVSVTVDNASQMIGSDAGRVAARLIARISLEGTVQHLGGCDCEICQAMREKLVLNPTIH
jgi:hypothetical protein